MSLANKYLGIFGQKVKSLMKQIYFSQLVAFEGIENSMWGFGVGRVQKWTQSINVIKRIEKKYWEVNRDPIH